MIELFVLYICYALTYNNAKAVIKMIVNFSVKNFGPIKDKQTLSFEADKSKHLEDYYVINKNGKRLLKLGLIYGANASGKTTVLYALNFLRKLVLNPLSKKIDKFEFKPFLFDKNTPNENTEFTIEFIQNETRYLYEVELNQSAIINESLTRFNPAKANVFKRVVDIESQVSEVKFGSTVVIAKSSVKSLELNTLWNNSVFGGYLKTNIESKELKDCIDWFEDYLTPVIYTKTELEDFVTSKLDTEEMKKSDIVNILQKADFNISNVLIKENDVEIPDGLLDFLEKNVKTPSSKIEDIRNKGKITSVSLEFEHTVNSATYTLPFAEESEGTQRYYGLAGILDLALRNSIAIPIDELESSLHPDLFRHFLLSFLINSKQSQIISTTHNREILNDKDIFRNDSIWITDKSEDSATELYSLADFDSSVIRDTSNILNAYKIGRLGGIPNLGDYYIDLGNEEE